MRQLLISLTFLILATANAMAGAVPYSAVLQENRMKEKSKIIFYLGEDLRFERNETMNLEMRQILNFGLGMRKGKFAGFLEGGTYKDSSSNGNISIGRKYEQFTLSGALISQLSFMHPYVGGGLGMYRDQAEYSVASANSRSVGSWENLGLVYAGVRLFPRSLVWVSVEGRLTLGSRLDPNPVMGLFLRLGGEASIN